VDLTDHFENKTTPYKTNAKYIKYPITDHKIPEDWKSYAQLILELCDILKNLNDNEYLYIHCRAGHGRSGVLVATLLCQYSGLTPEEALIETSKCHANRPEMKEKWRRLGSPQGKRQRDFIYRFFRPLRYGSHVSAEYTYGLDNFTNHPVTTHLGTFPNAHLAFQAFRNPENKEYIEALKKGVFLAELVTVSENWEEKKVEYMMKTLMCKFRQHYDLKVLLVNTGLRKFIRISHDPFWGSSSDGKGKNIHGKLLYKIRNIFLKEDFQPKTED